LQAVHGCGLPCEVGGMVGQLAIRKKEIACP
jgi:hypothetical protein